MGHPVFIDATGLDQWADRLDARGWLPTLVRRLVLRDGKVTSLDFPAGEGIQKRGFDGIVRAAVGNVV